MTPMTVIIIITHIIVIETEAIVIITEITSGVVVMATADTDLIAVTDIVTEIGEQVSWNGNLLKPILWELVVKAGFWKSGTFTQAHLFLFLYLGVARGPVDIRIVLTARITMAAESGTATMEIRGISEGAAGTVEAITMETEDITE